MRLGRPERVGDPSSVICCSSSVNHTPYSLMRNPDHQDTDDFEGIVAVPCHGDLRSTHVGDIHQRTGGRVLDFGIDCDDGGFGIALEQRHKAFRLFPGVAEKVGSDFVVSSARRHVDPSQQAQN